MQRLLLRLIKVWLFWVCLYISLYHEWIKSADLSPIPITFFWNFLKENLRKFHPKISEWIFRNLISPTSQNWLHQLIESYLSFHFMYKSYLSGQYLLRWSFQKITPKLFDGTFRYCFQKVPKNDDRNRALDACRENLVGL